MLVSVSHCFRVEIVGGINNCDKAVLGLVCVALSCRSRGPCHLLEAVTLLTFIIVIIVVALIVDDTIAVGRFNSRDQQPRHCHQHYKLCPR